MGAYGGTLKDMTWPATLYFEADNSDGSEPICELVGYVGGCGPWYLDDLLTYTAEAAFAAGAYIERPGDWAHIILVPGTQHDDLDDEDMERAAILWSASFGQ